MSNKATRSFAAYTLGTEIVRETIGESLAQLKEMYGDVAPDMPNNIVVAIQRLTQARQALESEK